METHPSAAFIHQISLWNTLWKMGKVEVHTVPEQGTPSPGVTGISPINKQDYKPPFRLPGEDSARAGKSIPALTHTETGHQCCTMDSLPCSHQENVPAIINSLGNLGKFLVQLILCCTRSEELWRMLKCPPVLPGSLPICALRCALCSSSESPSGGTCLSPRTL